MLIFLYRNGYKNTKDSLFFAYNYIYLQMQIKHIHFFDSIK